jgi:uncharacterized membrane protein HdeD (DUF308 family)
MRLQLVQPTRRELAARCTWHEALGVAFLVVAAGILAGAVLVPPGELAAPFAWSLLALALVYAAAALVMTGDRARGFQLAVTLAYAEAGVVLLFDPQVGALLLLFTASAAFALGGVAQLAAAVFRPHAQSRWEAGSGAALVALGAMVALQWPLSGIPSLCAVFGLAAAAQGSAYLRLAGAGARLADARSVRAFIRKRSPPSRASASPPVRAV